MVDGTGAAKPNWVKPRAKSSDEGFILSVIMFGNR